MLTGQGRAGQGMKGKSGTARAPHGTAQQITVRFSTDDKGTWCIMLKGFGSQDLGGIVEGKGERGWGG